MPNLQRINNFTSWLTVMFKEFVSEMKDRSEYEVMDVFECKKTGCKKVIIKLSGRHVVEKNVSEIITDNDLLEGLDKKTIRTLTYIATVEKMKPTYSVVGQQLSEQVDEYLMELQSKNKKATIKKTPIEIAKDKSILEKLGAVDASRIGYLAGVRETVKEFELKNKL